MSRVNFVQADVERLMRAAKRSGMGIVFDMRTLEARVLPIDDSLKLPPIIPEGNFAPDGKENWDED